MRSRFLAFSLLLAVPLAGSALAQSGSSQGTTITPKAAEKARTSTQLTSVDCRKSPDKIKACGEAWLRECVRDWDRATHMTKQEFTRTCQRVVSERVKALSKEAKATAKVPPAKATPVKAKATPAQVKAKE
jgi:hypothetical protein